VIGSTQGSDNEVKNYLLGVEEPDSVAGAPESASNNSKNMTTTSVPLRVLLLALTLLSTSPVWADILTGRIVGVTDGDTVTVLDAQNRQTKIRLTGIDAPEKKMPFGQRAKEHLSNLGFDKSVQIETEKLDRYGRTLGKIVVNNRDVNLAMIQAGFAWHYKKYQSEQSSSDRLLYAHAEVQARQQRAGLWRDPQPVPPWEWRKSGRAAEEIASSLSSR
jgi:endonuclease YncB( thermonuclease family)